MALGGAVSLGDAVARNWVWWTKRWFVVLSLSLSAGVLFFVGPSFTTTGRQTFYVLCYGTALLGASVGYWKFGPDGLMEVASVDLLVDDEEVAEAAAPDARQAFASAPPWAAPLAPLDALPGTTLPQRVGGSSLDAFAAFGAGGQGLEHMSGNLSVPPLAAPLPNAVPSGTALYAPFSTPVVSQEQTAAGEVLDGLKAAYQHHTADPYWGSRFWLAVANLHRSGRLTESVLRTLAFHGYTGAAAVNLTSPAAPPRMPELQRELESLIATASPVHAAPVSAEWAFSGDGLWDSALAPDFKRAGFEIYRSIRSAGSRTVREWLSANCAKARDTPLWLDLWTTATNIDFILTSAAQKQGEMGIRQALAQNDILEIGLRRLASQIYYDRTRDKTGSQAMLGVTPPGAGSDIAPSWLVADATVFSKSEHQREERVYQADARRRKGGGKGDERAPGTKGRKGRKGGGKDE